MGSALTVTVNGKPRSFDGLSSPSGLGAVLETLGLRPDRIAVELNGEIAPRTRWNDLTVTDGDRLEVVHFVGGGCGYGAPTHGGGFPFGFSQEID